MEEGMILFYDAVRKITVSSWLGAMVFKVCSGGTVGPLEAQWVPRDLSTRPLGQNHFHSLIGRKMNASKGYMANCNR